MSSGEYSRARARVWGAVDRFRRDLPSKMTRAGYELVSVEKVVKSATRIRVTATCTANGETFRQSVVVEASEYSSAVVRLLRHKFDENPKIY